MFDNEREENPQGFDRPGDLALHILHTLDQSMCLIDGEDRFLFVNKAFAGLYGIGPESIHGWPMRELIGESFYDKRIRPLLERARQDGASRFQGWLEYPHGKRLYIQARIRMYDHPELVDKRCLLLQWCDLTEREEMDQRRRSSLKEQETLLSHLPAMVWISGEDGKPYYYNQRWLEFTGNSLVEQVRTGWLAHVHPEDRKPVEDRIQYAIENEDSTSIEFRLLHLTGSYQWVRMHGDVVREQTSGKGEFITSSLEIDNLRSRQETLRNELLEERHLREEALRQKAAADRSNQEKSAYLSLASHEIRTPMNPVIGFADLLASSPNLDGDSKEMAQMILKAGKNLLTLLDEVLDYAKIEAGVLHLSPEPMDLHDLLIEIENLYSYDAKSRGIELRVIDGVDGESEFYHDRLRLQQVVGTLVSNGIKFTHTGHVELSANIEEVDSRGDKRARMIRLKVSDTGVGMSEEEVKQLFKPFARADATEFSEKYSGTGLGLAIAQKLIDEMSGTVSVESVLEKGTTIEIVIPMTPVPEHLQRGKRFSEPVRPENVPQEEVRMVVVDDEQSSRVVHMSLMRFLGYTCDQAQSGTELLEKMKRHTYDLILMDIMMPELDGFEVTRRIRNGDCGERNREAFIIAVTACVSDEDEAHGKRAGFSAFLSKPLTIQALRETISRSEHPRFQAMLEVSKSR